MAGNYIGPGLGAWPLADAPRIVFLVSARNVMETMAHNDPICAKYVRAITDSCDLPAQRHTEDKWTVGWAMVRVDDANRIFLVDEMKSDVLASLLEWRATGCASAGKLVEALSPWSLQAFATVRRLAHAAGYKAAMHSRHSVAAGYGMTQGDRQWDTCCIEVERQFALRAVVVPDYPAGIMIEG